MDRLTDKSAGLMKQIRDGKWKCGHGKSFMKGAWIWRQKTDLWYKPYDDKKVYAAIGDIGNIIYVNMEKKISVGITGTFKPRIFDRVDFIEKKVLPVIG